MNDEVESGAWGGTAVSAVSFLVVHQHCHTYILIFYYFICMIRISLLE